MDEVTKFQTLSIFLAGLPGWKWSSFSPQFQMPIGQSYQAKHMGKTTSQHPSTTPMVSIFSSRRLAEYIYIYICDGGTWTGSYGWLMLSVCGGPVQYGPARLEPMFTQPLWPDWEALFSHPGAFQRKPPAEAPRISATLKTIHSAWPPLSRQAACRGCTLIILGTQRACGTVPQKLHVACLQIKSHVFPLLAMTAMFSTSGQGSSVTLSLTARPSGRKEVKRSRICMFLLSSRSIQHLLTIMSVLI